MDNKNEGLKRLKSVYEKLDTGEKEKIIVLAEELLKSQKITGYERPRANNKTENGKEELDL
jgi:hypothetical protein